MFRADAGTGERQSITSSAPADEHRRSLAFAERAVTLIKALKLPASPRIYELCYAYATGEYPSLNIAINDLLNRRVAVGGDLIEQIGARYIPSKDHRERFDKVGVRVNKVIGRVLGSLDDIIEDEGAFSADLAQTPDKLTAAGNRNALVGEIRNMMHSAKFIGEQQRGLEEKLNVSIGEINELRDQLQKIRNANVTDPLTGLPNRTAFERSLQKAVDAAVERKAPLWLALCDIDDFKKFNNAWGHQTGDQVLCLVGMEIRQKVGKSGTVARLGGAQFAAFMSDMPLSDAHALADKIRTAVMSRDITLKSTNQRLGRVQVSFGIAGARADDTSDSLVFRAQACLRAAKDHGRNRIVCDSDGEAPAPELKVAFG
jgi:diguanylate cyclase